MYKSTSGVRWIMDRNRTRRCVTRERRSAGAGLLLKDRAEDLHLPFRRRTRAMLRFRQMKTLQKFASVRRPNQIRPCVCGECHALGHIEDTYNLRCSEIAAADEYRIPSVIE